MSEKKIPLKGSMIIGIEPTCCPSISKKINLRSSAISINGIEVKRTSLKETRTFTVLF